MDKGFVTLHRQFLEWEWYTDTKTKTLFIHCLLKANHTNKTWRGQEIKRGQFITSLQNLALETGLSVKEVRTCLKKLEKTGELGKQSTKLNTLISVTCYDKYQTKGKQEAKQGQSKGKQGATTNNDNNKNNDNKLRLEQFDLWWSKYPSGVNKKGAKEKFLKLKDNEVLNILNTIDGFVKYKPFEAYTHPNPCTYLNQRRWEDELPTTPQSQVADDLKPFLDIVNNDPKYKYKTDSQKVFEAGVLKALSQNS